MDLGLNGKVAIVSGGSDGIGKAAAWRLAKEGAKVAICARRKDVLEQAAQQIRTETNGEVLTIVANVADPQDIERVVQTIVEHYGGINILVSNAGVASAGPFEDVADETWQTDLDLKLWAAIRFARASIPHMRKAGGGRIINVTAVGGKVPGASSVPTSVSRAAGIALTKALSKDLAKDNILVNTVCIGFVKSGQWQVPFGKAKDQDPSLTMDGFYEQLARNQNVPLGRIGETQEAGDVIAFLASDRASYLTGVALNIDGGVSPVV
jgi:NAD(P)-dependent dehydrogenase (short-subunit alcohol dehydrogenase family)